jgi:hypothetical protein
VSHLGLIKLSRKKFITTALINNFGGGHAEDLRTHNTDECEYSKNFDVFTNPHKLLPYGDSILDTITALAMNDIQLTDIDVCLVGGAYTIVGVGDESGASNKVTFYKKTDVSSVWTQVVVSASGAYVKGSGVYYKDHFYALAFNGSTTYTLFRLNDDSTVTNCGTIASTNLNIAKPKVHPEDNVLYIVIGTTITSWDNATLTTYASILPLGMEASSITDFGTYLAIAMTPLKHSGDSMVYLWGRDGTINTLQTSINFGEGNITVLENLNNVLFGVMIPQSFFYTSLYTRFKIKGYSGGAVNVYKSIMMTSSTIISKVKAKSGDKLYFCASNDDAMYSFGKNKVGNYIVTKDRYLNNGANSGSSIGGLSVIGDVFWRAFATPASGIILMRSETTWNESTGYTSISKYKTTINPCMGTTRYTVMDKHKVKTLEGVAIKYTSIGNSGTVGVQVSIDGGSFIDIISETNVTGENIKETTVRLDGTPFGEGREFQFIILSSGGAQINELNYKYNPLETYV